MRDVLDALQRHRAPTLRVTVLRSNGSAGSRLDDSSASLELESDSTFASTDATQVTRRACTSVSVFPNAKHKTKPVLKNPQNWQPVRSTSDDLQLLDIDFVQTAQGVRVKTISNRLPSHLHQPSRDTL